MLRATEDKLLSFIAGDMPQSMRDSLKSSLVNAFMARAGDKAILRNQDSSSEGNKYFEALHFSYYARFGTKVSARMYRRA